MVFFCQFKKAYQTKRLVSEDNKNCQHQHKGKPHTQEKYQDAGTSFEDANADTVHTSGVET
jgi:hypothetical protein